MPMDCIKIRMCKLYKCETIWKGIIFNWCYFNIFFLMNTEINRKLSNRLWQIPHHILNTVSKPLYDRNVMTNNAMKKIILMVSRISLKNSWNEYILLQFWRNKCKIVNDRNHYLWCYQQNEALPRLTIYRNTHAIITDFCSSFIAIMLGGNLGLFSVWDLPDFHHIRWRLIFIVTHVSNYLIDRLALWNGKLSW